MPSEKKQNYILEGKPKIRLITFLDVSIIPQMLNLIGGLSSLRSCDQGTSAGTYDGKLKVQSLTHVNPISLLYKKILARIKLDKTAFFFEQNENNLFRDR